MPGRNPEEAWREFRDPIQRVVNCVDIGVPCRERRLDGDRLRWIASPVVGVPFGEHLSLNFALTLEAIEDDGVWRMTTKKYDYTVVRTRTPADRVFGWHWHPFSKRSGIKFPHLHVPSALEFSTRHIITGRVALEDVILFGVDQLNVPLAYDGARSVIEAARDRHKKYRSWA